MAKSSELLRRLQRAGFALARHGKEHDIWAHADGRRLAVARHPGEIPQGTYRRMLKQAGLSEHGDSD